MSFRGSRCVAASKVCVGLAAFFVVVGVAEPGRAQRARRSVECSTCIGNYYYFDQNAASGAHRDWNCGSSSYDGHRGSDWSLSGGLGAIDAGHNVVAVADGTVVTVNDGAFDRCTSCPATGTCGTSVGFGFGNYVRIDHGTRSVIYAHMRTRSIRVSVGARVTCGQVIGQIASSGCSTGAHLHTEFRTVGGSSGTAYDPYEGSCSSTRPSAWTTQNAYRTLPGANCDGSPPPPMCPSGTYPIWTCDTARTQRTRCISGMVMTEPCPGGCVVQPVGTDDYCNPPPSMCSAGLGAEWACNTGRTARARCASGRDQTEACPYGCRVNTPGDDTCNPAPMCSAGVGPEWTCSSDAMSRRRCVMGTEQTEMCANGCVMQAGDDTCRAGQGQDAGTGADASTSDAAPPSDVTVGADVAPTDAGADAARADATRDARGDGGVSQVDGGCGCVVDRPVRRARGGLVVGATSMLFSLVVISARRRNRRRERVR